MENIKTLWSRLLSSNKSLIIETISKEYGLSESSVRTNWFSSWKIPEHCMARVHELLINILKTQQQTTKEAMND